MPSAAHMGVVKTLDREYLATHPEGDERADVTLSHPVPDAVQVPANADGTRAKISLRVTADTYHQAITALAALHEDGGEELLAVLLDDLVTEEELAQYGSHQDITPLLRDRAQEVVVPFRTFEVDGTIADGAVHIAITAPSVKVAVEASVGMTGARTLTNLAIGLCPTIEDEDDWADNEVLVVS